MVTAIAWLYDRALTAAIERKQFYDKKKMHVCAGQVVSRNVDRFLFEFFGLADATAATATATAESHGPIGRTRLG